MRFHRISPCPKCGGKVKAKWERDGVQGLPEYTFFTMMAIVQAFCLLVFLGLTVWQLNHLTWSITDYRVRISSNLEKGAHVEQSEK